MSHYVVVLPSWWCTHTLRKGVHSLSDSITVLGSSTLPLKLVCSYGNNSFFFLFFYFVKKMVHIHWSKYSDSLSENTFRDETVIRLIWLNTSLVIRNKRWLNGMRTLFTQKTFICIKYGKHNNCKILEQRGVEYRRRLRESWSKETREWRNGRSY